MSTVVRTSLVRPLRSPRGPRAAFSLIELLVIVAIVVILFSIFVPYAMKMREASRRGQCADNLRTIAFALSQYAALRSGPSGHDYPRVAFDPTRPGYAVCTGADSPSPFAPGTTVAPNDVTASLWLLARTGLAEPYRFVCPSTGDTPDPMSTAGQRMRPAERSNFTSLRHLSYSYCSPFSTASGFQLNDVLPPDFAVVADKNPGIGDGADVTAPAYSDPPLQLARANSTNHNRSGQNVLYGDYHVQFQKTPYCGVGQEWKRDNIYTAAARIPLPPGAVPAPEGRGFCERGIGPAWQKDSYLVPTATD
jgi:type II secretory pathway pseudopilin PulG